MANYKHLDGIFHIGEKILVERGVLLMAKYRCVCGYTYDEEKGIPENGIPPGTPFEKLPDEWICPICRAEKWRFIKKEKRI